MTVAKLTDTERDNGAPCRSNPNGGNTMSKIVGGVGVDGGGFIITSNGIIPVPPWDPMVRVRLDAVVALARLGEVDSGAEVAPVVRQLVSEVSERLGAGGDARYVYFSADGDGFTATAGGDELCPVLMEERLRKLLEKKGRPGLGPDPDPQPHWLVEAVTAGAVRQVLDRGGDLGAFLDAPEQIAASLDLTVPDVALRRVRQLAIN
jgi:hypothetical protein